VTVTYSGTFASGNLSVAAVSCGGTGTAKTLAITKSAIPSRPSSISGSNSVCTSSTVTYSISAVSGATSYTWTAPTNATIASGQGTTSVTVSFASGFTSGSLSVRASNCSGLSTARSRTISKASAPSSPGTISGTASVCVGSTITYSISSVSGATSYTWTAPANATIASGQGTTSVTVSFTNSFTSGNLSVSANGCGGTSNARTLAIAKASAPSTPGTISGTTSICSATTLTYSIASVSGATSYTWTAPINASITSGQGTTSITVAYTNAFTGGNITVTATGCGGTSAARSLAISKTTGTATPGTISGPTSGLCKQTAATYFISSVTGATSYTWSVPTGAVITSGQGTTSIVVNFTNASLSTSNTLSVIANSACGSSTARTLTFNGLPSAPTTINGNSNPCRNTVTTYSVSSVYGASGYTWTVPSGWVIQSGQGTATLTVKTGSSSSSGSITVKANSQCGSSSTLSRSISVRRCDSRIGADDETATNLMDIRFYPNPVNDVLNIAYTSLSSGDVTIRMYDATGRLVLTEQNQATEGDNQITLHVGNILPVGLYIVEVQQAEQIEKSRVIIAE
jgi:hypothetical protein